ncbi:hypothetical protein [Nannocystis sp. SCPEA4]|uniref:hypothetical protein n=1 Tax=Nannocystis sp. SCPEA4 TaxID=2996787 RepID=UPI00226E5E7F|nr:hypothetical protein [Nannocystis sp. SCPEA4]MCY1061835.1 hypothetical protein [Nannocystis sp. SCPEA4]
MLLWAAPLPGESEFVLEDPLALDYLSQQVGYFLLPALTTRSGHAQYFAMVLYGLELVERALRLHGMPDDDDVRRQLFERWERFWALAVVESRNGPLGRGHPDAMRGARGVNKAWVSGEKPLSRDYPLISRQSELGGLGAYLVPLRDLGLVYPGSLRVTPAATPIVELFWGEPVNAHSQRFDNWALHVLAPASQRIERKFQHIRLATLGERSRLSSILARPAQQSRLFEAVVERAPPPTLAVARLVEQAASQTLDEPRDMLTAMIAGQCGPVDERLRDVLALAVAFGDAAVAVRGCFDAIYGDIMDAGFIGARTAVLARALTPERLSALRSASAALLRAPAIERLQQLPMHGRAFLRLAEELAGASDEAALASVLAFHRRAQRDRSSGDSWIAEEGGDLQIVQTRYTGYRAEVRFPPFKLNIVHNLLTTTGRLPSVNGANA